MKIICRILFLTTLMMSVSCLSETEINLPKPDNTQYRWHEQERIMFVCLDPCTWQGREYDNHSTPLSRINPSDLNTDQWCEAAISWGAKEILFVAKHTGGFCWWQTETSDYSIKNTPYKNGKGDVLKELSESCEKYGLNLGIYVYPGDETWGAGIGSGGLTSDPQKQEAYNKIFRQQLTEVLTRYGKIMEVWFDGSCVIKVDDILEMHASESVVLQGPKASIRWPGTESGKLYYPAWNSLKMSALKTGISTQYDDDPDGDAWAPLEADVTLYNHNWFWSAANENKRRTVDELMDIYYKSAGHGGVLLLNSTPDTTGLIPAGDIQRYREFGNEIKRRFENPLAVMENKKGTQFGFEFDYPTELNHVILMEDYRKGHRIREYSIDALTGNEWKQIVTGTALGRMKIDCFPTVEVKGIRVRITGCVNEPLIRSISLYNVDNYRFIPDKYTSDDWKLCGKWDTRNFKNGSGVQDIELTEFITRPGQYEVAFTGSVVITGIKVVKAEIFFDNDILTQQDFIKSGDTPNTFYINRTAQVGEGSSTLLRVEMYSDNKVFQNKGDIRIRERVHVSRP